MYIRQIAFVFLFLVALPATAGAQSVYVLGINSIEGDDSVADRLSSAMRSALAEQGCSVAEGTTTLANMQLVVNDPVCANTVEIGCLNLISTRLETGSLVFGTLHRVYNDTGEELEAELHYYDRLERRIIGHFTERMSLAASDEELANVASRAAIMLAHCTHHETEPAPVDEPVVASAVEEPSTPTPAPQAHDSLDWLGVTLGGLALAAFAGDIGVWVRLNDLNHDADFMAYRASGMFMGGNVCTGATGHAADVCNEGGTLEVLEYVLLGTSLAALGGSIAVFVLGHTSESAPHVSLLPSISPSRASLTLAVDF